MLSFILSLFLFSFSGIPPLIGFFGKFFLIKTLIDLNLFILGFFILIMNCISSFYYVRLIVVIFFRNSNNFIGLEDLSFFNKFFISFFTLINISFFFFLSEFLNFIDSISYLVYSFFY